MNRTLCGILGALAMMASQLACANRFEGFYIGGKAGYNGSSAYGQSKSNGFFGGEAGYNTPVSGNIMLGGDFWADDHTQSMTGRDWGVDAKLGNVVDHMMYYVKLGVAATHPGNRVHYGLGLEYKFDRNWGALAEWTGDSMSKSGTTYNNNNFVVGATYHF